MTTQRNGVTQMHVSFAITTEPFQCTVILEDESGIRINSMQLTFIEFVALINCAHASAIDLVTNHTHLLDETQVAMLSQAAYRDAITETRLANYAN
jgi:hypothetical protein